MTRRLDGLGRYAIGLAGALLKRDAEIELHLIVPDRRSADHPLEPLLAELKPPTVACGAGLFSLSSHVRVPAAVRRVAPDLYHYPHFNLPLWVNVRSVATIHDLTPLIRPDYFSSGALYKRAYFRIATAWTLRRASAVITPSYATAAAVQRIFRPRVPVVPVPEGADPAFDVVVGPSSVADLRERFGLPRPFLLYVGVDRPHKNLGRLISAFARVAERIPHDLVLVGGAMTGTSEVIDAIARHALAGRVRRLGHLSEPDLRVIYAAADAFVLCSLVEGFGLPVLEAMRAGTPVITSREGSTEEVAGDAALLVDPMSVSEIAAALLAVSTDEALRNSLRLRGLERSAQFTWERAADRTIAAYRTALA